MKKILQEIQAPWIITTEDGRTYVRFGANVFEVHEDGSYTMTDLNPEALGLEDMPPVVKTNEYDEILHVMDRSYMIAARKVFNEYGTPLGAEAVGTQFAMKGKLLQDVLEQYEIDHGERPEGQKDEEGYTWFSAYEEPWLWDIFIQMIPSKYRDLDDPEIEGPNFKISDEAIEGYTYWNGNHYHTIVIDSHNPHLPNVQVASLEETIFALCAVANMKHPPIIRNGYVIYRTTPNPILGEHPPIVVVSRFQEDAWCHYEVIPFDEVTKTYQFAYDIYDPDEEE